MINLPRLGDYVARDDTCGYVVKVYIRGTQRGFKDRVVIRCSDGSYVDAPAERCVVLDDGAVGYAT